MGRTMRLMRRCGTEIKNPFPFLSLLNIKSLIISIIIRTCFAEP